MQYLRPDADALPDCRSEAASPRTGWRDRTVRLRRGVPRLVSAFLGFGRAGGAAGNARACALATLAIILWPCAALLPLAAQAATYTWTGAASGQWSNPGNWSPAGVPAAGDSLAFSAFAAANQTNTNDLPVGTSFAALALSRSNYTLHGNGIVLTGGLSNSGFNNVVNLPIDVQANAVEIVSTNGPLTLGGSLSGSGPISTGAYNGGSITLSAAGSYSGTLYAYDRLHLSGASLPGASVVSSSGLALSGNGTIGNLTSNFSSVSPGLVAVQAYENGTGILNTGNLLLTSGVVSMQINGAAPGSGYDRISATGTVALGTSSTSLGIYLGNTFVPMLGQQFVLIENDGADPVSGTFHGKPEGSIITLNGAQFVLSYAGGDGNDVTLTCVLSPKSWTGAAGVLWSDAGNWIGGVPLAGDVIQFPPGAVNLANTNDLAAGTAFSSVVILGSGYVLNGNGIVLTGSLSNSGANNTVSLPIDVQANAVSISNSLGLSLDGSLSGSGPIALTTLHGTSLRWAGSYSGTLTFYSLLGGVSLEGILLPAARVISSSALEGSGTVGALSLPGTGDLRPGRWDTGVLNTGDLTLGYGRVYVELVGAAPGTGYGQISVTGTVNLGTSTELILSMGPNFEPTLGQQFVLIRNDGVDAVIGTFELLPEGSVIKVNGHEYSLSYAGGDGNDVTLTTLVTTPGAPTAVFAIPGNQRASLNFVPPANDGGAAIDSYRAICQPGTVTATGPASPLIVMPLLADGTAYTCTVAAHNAAGWGPPSAVVAAVTAVPPLSRTYVASTGDDANTVHSCDSAHPCRSFAAAFSMTTTGGEILAVDGSGYGTLVIDRSVSIIANPGRFAGIGVFSGGTGISIATAGVNVTLRGLTLNGQGGSGAYGINMSDGARLSIENCVIAGFGSAGVYVNTPASVRVIDSVFRDNSRGLQLDGGASASIAGSKFHGNSGNAILVGGTAAGTLSTAAISHSVVMGSGADWGISAQSLNATAGARAHVIRSSVSNSAVGVSATSAAGGPASVVVSRSKVSGNATGLSQSGAGAVLRSLGNNAITGNTTDTAGTITAVPPM